MVNGYLFGDLVKRYNGVPATRLRYWVDELKRAGLIEPVKTPPHNAERFSPKDMLILDRLKAETEEGKTAKRAIQLIVSADQYANMTKQELIELLKQRDREVARYQLVLSRRVPWWLKLLRRWRWPWSWRARRDRPEKVGP